MFEMLGCRQTGPDIFFSFEFVLPERSSDPSLDGGRKLPPVGTRNLLQRLSSLCKMIVRSSPGDVGYIGEDRAEIGRICGREVGLPESATQAEPVPDVPCTCRSQSGATE
jgi:hypothetical protein